MRAESSLENLSKPTSHPVFIINNEVFIFIVFTRKFGKTFVTFSFVVYPLLKKKKKTLDTYAARIITRKPYHHYTRIARARQVAFDFLFRSRFDEQVW